MALERTFTQNVPKPWGSRDLRPWNTQHVHGEPIGEVWFQRADLQASNSALLMKLLFTTAARSIQVHADDAYAQLLGLDSGKSEAWYVLSALPDARIALGLKRRMGPTELRAAIDSGSIAELLQWRPARAGELVFVSAGTIHTIGPGLVLLQIQQRSEATFRLFDYGRQRALDIDNGLAAARGEQAARQAPWRKLTKERTLLLASRHFVLERFELPPGSDWELLAGTETWLFVLEGSAWVGAVDARVNEAIFLDTDSARIRVRSEWLKVLVAYVGSDPIPNLLRGLEGQSAGIPKTLRDERMLSPGPGAAIRDAQPAS